MEMCYSDQVPQLQPHPIVEILISGPIAFVRYLIQITFPEAISESRTNAKQLPVHFPFHLSSAQATIDFKSETLFTTPLEYLVFATPVIYTDGPRIFFDVLHGLEGRIYCRSHFIVMVKIDQTDDVLANELMIHFPDGKTTKLQDSCFEIEYQRIQVSIPIVKTEQNSIGDYFQWKWAVSTPLNDKKKYYLWCISRLPKRQLHIQYAFSAAEYVDQIYKTLNFIHPTDLISATFYPLNSMCDFQFASPAYIRRRGPLDLVLSRWVQSRKRFTDFPIEQLIAPTTAADRSHVIFFGNGDNLNYKNFFDTLLNADRAPHILLVLDNIVPAMRNMIQALLNATFVSTNPNLIDHQGGINNAELAQYDNGMVATRTDKGEIKLYSFTFDLVKAIELHNSSSDEKETPRVSIIDLNFFSRTPKNVYFALDYTQMMPAYLTQQTGTSEQRDAQFSLLLEEKNYNFTHSASYFFDQNNIALDGEPKDPGPGPWPARDLASLPDMRKQLAKLLSAKQQSSNAAISPPLKSPILFLPPPMSSKPAQQPT